MNHRRPTELTGIFALALTLTVGAGWHQAAAKTPPPAPSGPPPVVRMDAAGKARPLVMVKPSRRPRIDVVFALDTTGSMSSLIAGAKQKIWSIINALADGAPTPIIRVGLIGYRDKRDAYVTKRFGLSANLDQIYGHLMGFAAGGGGDTPEHVNQALYEAVHQMQWSQSANTLKVIFLVGDAPPKMGYQDDVKYHVTAAVARKRQIIINTVRCGRMTSTASVWGRIAQLAGGKYISVAQGGGMLATRTPYDLKLSALSRKLDSTYVFYGSGSSRKDARSRLDRATRAVSGEVAASRAGVRAKLGAAGVSRVKRDLVALQARKPRAAQAVAANQLPATLARMSVAARQRHLKGLWKKRQHIQREIVSLSKQRGVYLVKQVKLAKVRAKEAKVAARRARIAYEKGLRSGRLKGRAAKRAHRRYRTLARKAAMAAAPARPSFSDSAVRTLKRQAAPKGISYR